MLHFRTFNQTINQPYDGRFYPAGMTSSRGLNTYGTAPTPAGSASSVADHVADQQPVMSQAAAAAGAEARAAATVVSGDATPPAAPPGASGEQLEVALPAADKSAVELGYDFMDRPLAGYLTDAARDWGWKADHAKLLERLTAAGLATGVGGAGLYAALQSLQQPTAPAPVVVSG